MDAQPSLASFGQGRAGVSRRDACGIERSAIIDQEEFPAPPDAAPVDPGLEHTPGLILAMRTEIDEPFLQDELGHLLCLLVRA